MRNNNVFLFAIQSLLTRLLRRIADGIDPAPPTVRLEVPCDCAESLALALTCAIERVRRDPLFDPGDLQNLEALLRQFYFSEA